jgi:tetratricopeptide (TPR) repeat protein
MQWCFTAKSAAAGWIFSPLAVRGSKIRFWPRFEGAASSCLYRPTEGVSKENAYGHWPICCVFMSFPVWLSRHGQNCSTAMLRPVIAIFLVLLLGFAGCATPGVRDRAPRGLGDTTTAPDRVSALPALVRQLRQKMDARDFDGAIVVADDIINRYPEHHDTYHYRALARQSKGDLPGALKDYDVAVRLLPKAPNTLTNRGNVKAEMGDEAGALADFERSFVLDPNVAITLNGRGGVRHRAGDYRGALQDFNRAQQLAPNDPEPYCNRGITRIALGDGTGALADFNEAIRLNPEFPKAYNNRGILRENRHDFAGALSDFASAISMDGKYAVAFKNRGSLLVKSGRLAEGIADLDSAIAMGFQPLFAAYTDRGIGKVLLKDYCGAAADFDRAIEINSNYVPAYRSRSELRLLQGDFAGARADFTKAESLSRILKSEPLGSQTSLR